MSRGPLPNATHSRARDTARREAQRVVYPVTGQLYGPPDLQALTGVPTWSSDAETWYQAWRSMPHAVDFEATDWQRLGFLARLVEKYLATPTAGDLREIRAQESMFAATMADRARARIIIDKAAPLASVAPIRKSARDRLAATDGLAPQS